MARLKDLGHRLGRGAIGFRRAGATRGGRGTEKFGDVTDVGETERTKFVFDGDERDVQFEGGRRIEFVDRVGGLADDVIVRSIIEAERVERGAVVEVSTAHNADFFENRHAAINGHEITTILTEGFVNGFDALGLAAAKHRGQDRQTGLRNPEVGGFEASGRGRHGGLCIGFG